MPIIRMPDGVNVRFDDNMPKEQIQSMIASKYPDFAKSMGYNPMTDEQRAQIQANKDEYNRKQAERNKDQWFVSLVENKPEGVVQNITRPVARLGLSAIQGISNAGLNPAGYVARAAGIDTKPLEAENTAERATELAGQYGFDAAALVPTLGLAAEAAPAVAPYVAPLVEGGIPLALTGSTGSALATGIINPESTVGRMATDILGGGLGAGLTRPKFTAPKQDVKTVKELTKSIGEDALNRDIAEAERAGRNLLEVGGDEVMQAAQQARQQSPEARKIITDTLESSIAEQPTRTRGVINEALGTKGKNATITQVMENAKAEAQPLYDEATKAVRNTSEESLSKLSNIVENNDVVNDAIKSVKRSYSSYKNMPDTDSEVLLQARKVLSKQTTSLDPTKAFEAREALKELDPILNNITGGKLAQANKLYSDAYQFERAADLGRDVFNSRKSPDDLKTAWNSLSSTEKQAAKIGLREEVMNKIGSATNETNALNRFLPENVREKITTIAGNKEGGRIIDEAEQAVKLRRNYNKLTSGSQTPEKQSLRDTLRGIRGFVRNPWETTVDALAKPFDTRRNIRMAEYLTENPTSLKDAFNRVNMTNKLNAERMPKRTPYLQSALRAIIEEK